MNPIYVDKKYNFSLYEKYIEIPGFLKKKKILLDEIKDVKYNNFFKRITFFTENKKYSISVKSKDFAVIIQNFLLKKINTKELLDNIKQDYINNNPELLEAKEYIELVNKNKKFPSIITELFLKENEEAILEEVNSELQETRAVRRNSGSGGSIRIAKGVRIGGYSGTSSSSQEWKILDYGTLTLTNKRLVYVGNKENRDLLISKIISAKLEKENFNSLYLEISVSNRKKSIKFSINGNKYIWEALIQLLKQGADLSNLEKDIDLEIKI